jgi:hypothetical protein
MAAIEKDLTAENNLDIIRVEKNLESLGFFTPSSKALKGILSKKSNLTVKRNGEKLELSVMISSTPEYGLPITQDFDLYRAFQKLLHLKLINDGQIVNPISFKSNQIIKLMGKEGHRCKGLYNDIDIWLKRMVAVTIDSSGVIYLAGKEQWMSDTFHVFERVVAYGEKLNEKTYADQNYVWLGSWYLENLNLYYLKTIDFEYHKALRRPLSKSLYALLDIGFYASKHHGYYHKNYTELCEFLNITEHSSLSLIKRQLDPPHQELKDKGNFLEKWEYEPCKSGTGYNILWYPGQKFFSDQKARLDKKQMALDFTPHQIEQGEETIDLVGYFQRKMNNINNHIPKKKETSRARELLEKCNGDKEKAFWIVDYAVKEMQKTNFQAQYFGAVTSYIDKALLAFDKSKMREQEQQAARKREFEAKKREYEAWLSQTPEQRVKHRVEFWLEAERNLRDREPSESEIEEKTQEYISQLPSSEEKQKQLFGKVIF